RDGARRGRGSGTRAVVCRASCRPHGLPTCRRRCAVRYRGHRQPALVESDSPGETAQVSQWGSMLASATDGPVVPASREVTEPRSPYTTVVYPGPTSRWERPNGEWLTGTRHPDRAGLPQYLSVRGDAADAEGLRGHPGRPVRAADRCSTRGGSPRSRPGPERTPVTSTDTSSTPPQGAALAEMRLTELKSLAQQMGLKGLSGKRKSELVALIDGARGGRPAQSAPAPPRGGAQNADAPAGGAGRSDDAAERADKPARDDRDSTSGGRGDGDGGQGGDNRAGRDQGARRPRGGQSRDGQDPGTQDRDQNKRGDQRDHGEHHNRGQDSRGGENAPRGDKQHNRDKNN